MTPETVSRIVRKLLLDENGQDLIEYGFLTAVVGIVGVLAFATFSGRMENAYSNWNDGAQDVWVPCPPISLGGCP